MKMKDIKEMTADELQSNLAELRKEKLKYKIQSRTGQLEKTAQVREVRRSIARILTEQTERAAKESGGTK